jgi:hypothetical protein
MSYLGSLHFDLCLSIPCPLISSFAASTLRSLVIRHCISSVQCHLYSRQIINNCHYFNIPPHSPFIARFKSFRQLSASSKLTSHLSRKVSFKQYNLPVTHGNLFAVQIGTICVVIRWESDQREGNNVTGHLFSEPLNPLLACNLGQSF